MPFKPSSLLQRFPKLRFHLRTSAALVLIATACGIAVAAVHTGSAPVVAKSSRKVISEKMRHGPERAEALPGIDRGDGGPLAAALEDYAHRAYPAKEVPMTAVTNARKAWSNLKAMQTLGATTTQTKSSKNSKGGTNIATAAPIPSPGPWSLYGPSVADFPDVLTFSGAPYVDSGRITALAIDPACNTTTCRVWAAAAGGGVWRTSDALSSAPSWTFISGSFATNAIGTLTYDAANATLYAGTGEPNASADSEAGWGIYKSTDGGNTWTLLNSTVGPITTTSPGTGANGTYTGNAFAGRAISSIAVDPTNQNHLFVSSVRAVRGVGSTGGATSNPATPRPPFGLFESTDGGATFKFIWDGSDGPTFDGTNPKATIRGVNKVALDPGWNGTTNKIIYGGAFGPTGTAPGAGGVWRSLDGGVTWAQIQPARDASSTAHSPQDRAEFAVTTLPNNNTRIYAGIGNDGEGSADLARLYRTDDARAATPVFTDLTAAQTPNDPSPSATDGQTLGYCGDPAVGAQCWYDNVVYSPPGKPDVIYLGGSYNYSRYGFRNNGRAFLRSGDAGMSFTDMTWDAVNNATPPGTCCQPQPYAPNGMHPDSHAMLEIPGTDKAIFGSDGGLVRTSGAFADTSSQCDSRGLGATSLALCHQLLKAVPTVITSLNAGLSTLQFQQLASAYDNPAHLMGGTQDNGTFETYGSAVHWPQVLYGDGGFPGFSNAYSVFRLGSFTSNFSDVNFRNGDPTAWVIATGPIVASGESALFYAPVITDPNSANPFTIFQGSKSVWRTQDWSLGTYASTTDYENACPEFFTSGADPACGDFIPIGPAGATDLTASAGDYRGSSRAGGNVSFIARTPSDAGTMWVSTSTGRVFITKNANDATGSPAGANVTFTRLDTLAVNSPGRFITGIYVDSANSNHAWISYSGYAFNTPSTPGHVFSVVYNPGGGTATWTYLDGSGFTAFPDFPATAVVADMNGDIYAANDWGVMRLPSGSTAWQVAGSGLPQVEVSGLTIVPGQTLYAATHGRSAWQLPLPEQLVGAGSRFTHPGAGTFDVPLPLTGTSGVEPRSDGTGNYKIVLHFGNAPVSGSAAVTGHNPGGSGTVSSVSFSGNDMIVNLTGVTNAQVLTLTATNVTDVNGTTLPSVSINIGFLIGDVNSSRLVDSGDLFIVRQQSGQPVTSSNFREDVNVTGVIDSGDVFIVRQNSSSSIP